MDTAADRRAELVFMMPVQAHRRKQPHLRHLDPASQWAIRRFLIKLAAIGIFAVFIVKRPVLDSILVLASVNILTSVAIAFLYREAWDDDALNHWDEAMAFTGLCALAHTLKFALGWS